MGNVLSVLEAAGVPSLTGHSSVFSWAVAVCLACVRLSWRATLWFFGLSGLELGLGNPLRTVARHRGWVAAVVIAWRSLRALRRLLSAFIAPDLIMRQVAAVVVLQTVYETLRWVKQRRLASAAVSSSTNTEAELTQRVQNATSFAEWKRAQTELDKLSGRDKWRQRPQSKHYSYEQVSEKITHYKRLMERRDHNGLRWHLRAELLRKHFGLSHPTLYTVSKVGSKHIVEDYMETVSTALYFAANDNASAETADELVDKLAFFNETRHAFGRSALLLSGGASLGLYHLGTIRALLEKGLMPRVISGASAGSIAAGLLGVKTEDELIEWLDNEVGDLQFFGIRDASGATRSTVLPTLDRWWHRFVLLLPPPFKDIAVELRRIVPRWLKSRTLLDIEVLGDTLRRTFGDYTFQEAFERTGRIINITVVPNNSTDFPSLLNYLTAPHVLVWSAALASCAIPGVFASVELIAKDKGGTLRPYLPGGLRWSDGSVEMDLPMARLAELFNVNQFIVSQVNPHARLFAGTSLDSSSMAQLIKFMKRSIKGFIANLSDLGLSTFLKPVGRGLLPLVTQAYEGDCTIVPKWTWEDLAGLLRNPTRERFDQAILVGQRATWEKLSWIRNHCLIEFTLDECVRELRDRLAEKSLKHAGDAADRLGRVPSFHTSQSLVALSDLAGGVFRSPSRTSLDLISPPSADGARTGGSAGADTGGSSSAGGMMGRGARHPSALFTILTERAEEEAAAGGGGVVRGGVTTGGSTTSGDARSQGSEGRLVTPPSVSYSPSQRRTSRTSPHWYGIGQQAPTAAAGAGAGSGGGNSASARQRWQGSSGSRRAADLAAAEADPLLLDTPRTRNAHAVRLSVEGGAGRFKRAPIGAGVYTRREVAINAAAQQQQQQQVGGRGTRDAQAQEEKEDDDELHRDTPPNATVLYYSSLPLPGGRPAPK